MSRTLGVAGHADASSYDAMSRRSRIPPHACIFAASAGVPRPHLVPAPHLMCVQPKTGSWVCSSARRCGLHLQADRGGDPRTRRRLFLFVKANQPTLQAEIALAFGAVPPQDIIAAIPANRPSGVTRRPDARRDRGEKATAASRRGASGCANPGRGEGAALHHRPWPPSATACSTTSGKLVRSPAQPAKPSPRASGRRSASSGAYELNCLDLGLTCEVPTHAS